MFVTNIRKLSFNWDKLKYELVPDPRYQASESYEVDSSHYDNTTGTSFLIADDRGKFNLISSNFCRKVANPCSQKTSNRTKPKEMAG